MPFSDLPECTSTYKVTKFMSASPITNHQSLIDTFQLSNVQLILMTFH